MHGLLALSALHFALINPEMRNTYSLLSTRHQHIAVESFSSRLHDINADNCHAYVLTASFIFMINTFLIADARNNGQAITMYDLAQSFVLMQGKSIQHSYTPRFKIWR